MNNPPKSDKASKIFIRPSDFSAYNVSTSENKCILMERKLFSTILSLLKIISEGKVSFDQSESYAP